MIETELNDVAGNLRETAKQQHDAMLWKWYSMGCVTCREGYNKTGKPGATEGCQTCMANEAREKYEPKEPFSMDALLADVQRLKDRYGPIQNV